MRFSLACQLLLAAALSRHGAALPQHDLRESYEPSPVEVDKRATNCHITAYTDLAAAQTACATLTVDGIAVPSASGLNLNHLQTGAHVIFAGTITFAYTPSNSYKMVQISGSGLTITGAAGSKFDGGGGSYTGNSDAQTPGIFMKVTFTSSTMNAITIVNPPGHAVSVDGVTDSTFDGWSITGPLDGFDVGNVKNIHMSNMHVVNGDDCVALSIADTCTFTNFYCSGSHGLSVVGGGSGQNNISNVIFSDSTMVGGSIACRIKTDSGAQGTVKNITWQNIAVSNPSLYGIDIQQDYGNPGVVTNGVIVSDITFKNITGTLSSSASAYYILCGSGSCSGFTFSGINLTGGKASSCNYPSNTCPAMGTTGSSGTTTTTKATTTTTATKAATTTTSSSGATQSEYGQCGGTGWTGPTVCQSPYTCTYSNLYYSQCL